MSEEGKTPIEAVMCSKTNVGRQMNIGDKKSSDTCPAKKDMSKGVRDFG